jgi:hypothetical protein
MGDRLSALFCIGCGRVDIPEPCVGACDERVLDLVLAKECDAARTEIDNLTRNAASLRDLVTRLVSELPEPGAPEPDGWEQQLRTLRTRARSVLHDINAEASLEEVDRISAWRCVTCGWTEAPRECLGICVRDRVQFVPATDYDAVAETFADAVQQVAQLSTVVRQFAWVTPRAGEWDRTWRALHSQAVSALGATVQRNEEQISTSPVRS